MTASGEEHQFTEMDESTTHKLNEMGDTWGIQDEQIRSLEPLKYSSPLWIIVKAVLGVIILTTTYLLYNLGEIPWSFYESYSGFLIFIGVPFFVGFVLGMTFESGKKALLFALAVGLVSIGVMLFIMNMPGNQGLFQYVGPEHTGKFWWYAMLSFFNLISLVPIAAVIASSTNVYE